MIAPLLPSPQFFETFSEFKGRAFHLSGESYGGRYLPLYTSAVYDGNAYAAARNVTPINLQSVLIGNGQSWALPSSQMLGTESSSSFSSSGWTDSYTMYPGYVDQMCTGQAGAGIIQSIGTCVKLREAMPRCQEMFKRECRDRSVVCCLLSHLCRMLTLHPSAWTL